MASRSLLCHAAIAFLSVASVAQASPFSVTAFSATGADGFVILALTGDTNSSIGNFNYQEDEQAPNFIDNLSTSFDDAHATFSISNIMQSFSYPFKTVSADFQVSNPTFDFVVGDTNGTSQTIHGYTLNFFIQSSYVPQTGLEDVSNSFVEANQLLIPPPSNIASGVSTVYATGGPFFTPVPLPSSAPLFGAALLALGVVGFGQRRKGAAAI